MEVLDYTLDTLLDLNGFIAEIGDGYWVKMEAKRVNMDINKPHGLKYSLTLHSPEGERILGFDNAHAMPKGSSKEPHDHFHKCTRIHGYSYTNAEQLLSDFWKEVEKTLKARAQIC